MLSEMAATLTLNTMYHTILLITMWQQCYIRGETWLFYFFNKFTFRDFMPIKQYILLFTDLFDTILFQSRDELFFHFSVINIGESILPLGKIKLKK